ncbi:MAG: GMC family oxidoreductase [Sandaracinaceae bacterium]|nr:GMC family oxidoreductase [Sandaracinaceae bacterium]
MLDLDPSPAGAPALDPRTRRAALALAEAIVPGSRTVRPADERSLAQVEEVAARISPWASRLLSGFVELLDRAPIPTTGRRFADLDGAAQQAQLERFERDPVLRTPLGVLAFALKFVHFDRLDVYESLGGKLNVVQHEERPRYLSQVVEASAWDANDEIECEVVVVGTGAGGAVVGKELADRGFAVAFVEEGALHGRSSFTGSSVQAHFDFYRGSLTLGNAAMPIFMGRLVGGSTAINTGSCFRTPPWVLDRWCEDIGTDAFTPEAMRPYFERVERQLQVEEANAKAVGPIADVIARGCDALGWSHRRMMRNAPGCMGEGFCDFGCRTDARKSTNLSYIPPALEKGSMLFTGLRATRVRVEGGRAVGIEGVDAKGRTLRVRADAVVFSGGALPTPLFLLQQGLCNSSGQVGRNLTVHPSGGFAGLLDEQLDAHKHIPQGYYVDEHLRDGILINAAQPDVNFTAIFFPETGHRLMEHLSHADRMAFFGVLIADHAASGVVRPGPGGLPLARYSLAREDVARIHDGFVRTGEMLWAAGAKRLFMATTSWRVVRDRAEWRRFTEARLNASELMLTSYHPLGTCKMGTDPKTSVVGLDHETHDLPGLFLVDASTVPGPLGVNPQVTIMAMATRAAERIADKLR